MEDYIYTYTYTYTYSIFNTVKSFVNEYSFCSKVKERKEGEKEKNWKQGQIKCEK